MNKQLNKKKNKSTTKNKLIYKNPKIYIYIYSNIY